MKKTLGRLSGFLTGLAMVGLLVFATGTVDKGMCSASDAGAVCSGSEVVSSTNEEISALYDRIIVRIGTMTNSGNDYTGASSPLTTAYVDGQHYSFQPNATNTGTARVNFGAGLVDTLRADGTALAAGELSSSSFYLARYFASSNQMRVISILGTGATGDSFTINGSAVVDPDFDNAAPAALNNGANVVWQYSSPNLSAHIARATETAVGVTEFATTAEAAAQSSTTVAITPQGLAQKPEPFCFDISDQTTNLTTGNAKYTFRMPYAFTLTGIRAHVNTAPTGSTIIIDVNDSGTSIMTTNKLSIDASEETTVTAATAPALTDTSLADDAEITADIDQIGSTTPGRGAGVCFIGHQ